MSRIIDRMEQEEFFEKYGNCELAIGKETVTVYDLYYMFRMRKVDDDREFLEDAGARLKAKRAAR